MAKKDRVTAVIYCPAIDSIDTPGFESDACFKACNPEATESHVAALNATDDVAALQKSVLKRSHRQRDVTAVEEVFGFEMRLSSGDGPKLVSSDRVAEVLRDGDCVYIVPSQGKKDNPPMCNQSLPAELNTSLLCEMLEIDVDNFRWIMKALIKRRGSELVESGDHSQYTVTDSGLELEKNSGFGLLGALSGCLSTQESNSKVAEVIVPEVQRERDMFFMKPPLAVSALKSKSKETFALADLTNTHKESDDAVDNEGRTEEELDILQRSEYTLADFNFEHVIAARDKHAYGKPGDILPVVTFDRRVYYVLEGTPTVEIIVLRTGDLTPEVSVAYRTVDASAVSGLKYKGVNGRLKFESGVREQKLYVEIMENESFDVILEFNIVLENPEHCRLSQHSKQSRVRIIDDDFFPSNYVRQVVADGHLRGAAVRLWWEYFKSNISDGIIKRGTIKAMLVDVFENIRFLALLVMQVVLHDFVLSEKTDKQAAPHFLIWLSISYVTLFLCLHICSYRMCFWKIGGRSKHNLLVNLMRKFLNYSPNSRAAIVDTDVLLMITRHIPAVVSDGYMQMLAFLRHVLKLVTLLFYQLAMPYVYTACGLEKTVTLRGVVMSLVPIFVYPILMGAFLKLREKAIHSALYAEEDAQNNLIQFADEVIHRVQLITDYRLKNSTIDNWEAKVVKWTKAMVVSASRHCNNKYFAPWLTQIICAMWVFVGGLLVKESQSTGGESGISLGDFLVTWRVFVQAGDAWASMYTVLLTMQEAFPSLENLTMLMNLATDSRDTMVTYNRQYDLQKSEVSHILENEKLLPNVDYADMIPIKMVNFEHQILSHGRILNPLHINKRMPQGALYLLVGGKGSGKTTFLNILAGSILPYREKVTDLDKKIQHELEVTLHPPDADRSIQAVDSGKDSDSVRRHITPLSILNGWCPRSAKGRDKSSHGLNGDAAKEEVTITNEEVVNGDFLMPSHLHVLNVPSEPQFISGTLFDNLIMGIDRDHVEQDGDEKRIVDICRALAIPSFIIDMIQQRRVCPWDNLALSHRVLLCFARAFITNPEVLVLHKPMMNLNKTSTSRVMQLLRDFVDKRGLCQDPKKFWLRRPRTCFITGGVADCCSIADVIFEVHRVLKWFAVHKSIKEKHDCLKVDDSGNGTMSVKAAKLFHGCTYEYDSISRESTRL